MSILKPFEKNYQDLSRQFKGALPWYVKAQELFAAMYNCLTAEGNLSHKDAMSKIAKGLVKAFNIDKNTAFELEIDKNTGTVTLYRIKGLSERHSVSAGKSVEASVQQTPTGNQ